MNVSTTVQNMQARALQADNARLRYELTQVRAENMSLREQQNVVHRETEDRNQAAIELINGWIAEDDALQAAIDAAMWQAGERSLYRSLLRECRDHLIAAGALPIVYQRIDEILGD